MTHRRTQTSKTPYATPATLATLAPICSTRLRRTLVFTAALLAAGKILGVFLAVRIADGDVTNATAVGAVVIAMFAAARIASNAAQVSAECDLQRALTRAMLESDVLAGPSTQPLRALIEPAYHARSLITSTAPELAASAVAACVAGVVLVMRLETRTLAVTTVAVVVVFAALLALRRRTDTLQRGVWSAQEILNGRSASAIEGRLELVARGAENDAIASLERAIEAYRVVARRGAWRTALLGRAPLVAGLAVVVAIVALDSSSRAAVSTSVVSQALVLGASLPILLGVALRGNEAVRLAAMVAPLVDVLRAKRRAELDRQGATPPELPAPIVVRDLSFSYEPDSPPTLRNLSFEWSSGALVLQGPNGAGKSTLLRLLLGLRRPGEGSITIGGMELGDLDLRLLRRSIAYLPQRPYLGEPHFEVRSAFRAVDETATDEKLTPLLERVGLGAAYSASRSGGALDAKLGELSAGQRQRLALARVLLQDARIYLLDEPDANLDRAGVVLVAEIVAELVKDGRMVAIAAHTPDLAAIAGTRLTLA